MAPCRHCHARPPRRQCRGLCWRCHRDPATRALYPAYGVMVPSGRPKCVVCGVRSRSKPGKRCCRCYMAACGERPDCRHCGLRAASRAKGLCYACSTDPAVRTLYPSASKFAPGANNSADWPACKGCGERFPSLDRASNFCPVCQLPEPMRADRIRRLNEYQRRVAEGLPLPLWGRDVA